MRDNDNGARSDKRLGTTGRCPPFDEDLIEDFNVKFQSAVAPKAEGATSDLQEVFEDISLNYEYDPTHAAYVYSHFGAPDVIEQSFILPALYESFHRIWPVVVPAGLPAPPADFEAPIAGTEPWYTASAALRVSTIVGLVSL